MLGEENGPLLRKRILRSRNELELQISEKTNTAWLFDLDSRLGMLFKHAPLGAHILSIIKRYDGDRGLCNKQSIEDAIRNFQEEEYVSLVRRNTAKGNREYNNRVEKI